MKEKITMTEYSKLVSRSLGVLFPVILIFGLYIIANGHVSPGGGFQGGVLIMAVYICKYIINPMDTVSLLKLQALEKVVLVLIFSFALGFLATWANISFPVLNVAYLILMNLLIGIKVACGLTIIFYRFILYEVIND
jgi:multicomponent Na+:H+ antiporter subunit B